MSKLLKSSPPFRYSGLISVVVAICFIAMGASQSITQVKSKDDPPRPRKTPEEIDAISSLLAHTKYSHHKESRAVYYSFEGEDGFAWLINPMAIGKRSQQAIAIGKRTELAALVTALRCGLDDLEWNDPIRARICMKELARTQVPNSGELLPFSLKISYELYRRLLQPFEKDLDGAAFLIFPAGPLNRLPFQALVTRGPSNLTDNRLSLAELRAAAWLVKDRMPIVVGVGSDRKFYLFVMSIVLSQNAPSPERAPYIAFGDPILSGNPRCPVLIVPPDCPDLNRGPTQQRGRSRAAAASLPKSQLLRNGLANPILVRQLCPLPDTALELRCVASSLGGLEEDIFVSQRATETEVKRLSREGKLARYRVLHFATHGLVATDSVSLGMRGGQAAIVLTPPDNPTTEDDGLLTASEISKLRINADWVILSACNTGLVEEGVEDAWSELIRAFLVSGARSVLASYWPVDSPAAVKLVSTAVRKLLATAANPSVPYPRAEAMRLAMIEVLERGSEWEAHPSYWAPFVNAAEVY